MTFKWNLGCEHMQRGGTEGAFPTSASGNKHAKWKRGKNTMTENDSMLHFPPLLPVLFSIKSLSPRLPTLPPRPHMVRSPVPLALCSPLLHFMFSSCVFVSQFLSWIIQFQPALYFSVSPPFIRLSLFILTSQSLCCSFVLSHLEAVASAGGKAFFGYFLLQSVNKRRIQDSNWQHSGNQQWTKIHFCPARDLKKNYVANIHHAGVKLPKKEGAKTSWVVYY